MISVDYVNQSLFANGSESGAATAFDVAFGVDDGKADAVFTDQKDGSSASVSSSNGFEMLDLSSLEGSGADVHGDPKLRLELITGTAGDDVINMGASTVHAGDGDDVIWGGSGSGLFVLDGGLGHDQLHGGSGVNIYIVDSRYDRVFETYGGGNDTVDAAISYTLPTLVANLELTGTRDNSGTGNDLGNQLVGNGGHNVLCGMGGSDVLVGGLGQDVLTGGAGDDRFVFNSVADFASTKGDRCDLITDFSTGDRIDVSGLDHAKQPRFDYVGTAAFDGHGPELRMFTHGGDTFIQGDANGDKVVDFELRLTGVHALTAADFVL